MTPREHEAWAALVWERWLYLGYPNIVSSTPDTEEWGVTELTAIWETTTGLAGWAKKLKVPPIPHPTDAAGVRPYQIAVLKELDGLLKEAHAEYEQARASMQTISQ